MSEIVELSVLAAIGIAKISYKIGRALAGQHERTFQRHLIQQKTQITDDHLLRQSLRYLGVEYQEGEHHKFWGGQHSIELQVVDSEGRPWFALIKDEQTKTYSVLSLDRSYPQSEVPEGEQLSEKDPTETLARLAQNYSYARVMRELIHSGFELVEQSEEQRLDGSKIVVLQKQDKVSGELHTVQLVFKSKDGQATILTDSRRVDGSHGVCPDIDSVLKSAGINDYDKWTSLAAQQARQENESRTASQQTESGERIKQTERKRRKQSGGYSEI